jgi:hypothetical protein
MSMPTTMESLSEELYRRGVPAPQVRRIIGELNDHLADSRADLEAQGIAPESARALALERLGDAATLADSMSTELAQRTWTGRHPKIALLLVPLAVEIGLILFAALACTALVKGLLAWNLGHPMPFSQREIVLQVGLRLCYLAATFLGAGFLLWLSKKCNCALLWAVGSSVLLSVLCLIMKFHLIISPAPGQSTVGLGPGYYGDPLPRLYDWVRFAVPLVLLLLSYRENFKRALKPRT